MKATAMDQTPPNSADRYERMLTGSRETGHYVLRLYVTGMTVRSLQAVATIRAVCEEHLAGRYELEVIDIYEHPLSARDEQIIAAPTLVKRLPLPLRRLIGDLSDMERVLMGLDLRQKL